MQKVNLLEKGHHVYIGNYYSSQDLILNYSQNNVFFVVIVRLTEKNIPKAVTSSVMPQVV